VLVHDYHLALVPGMVRAARPDLRVSHFTHTPFCGPNSIRVLPTDVARDLCASMSTVPTGFHTDRWARAYHASAHEVLGPDDAVAASFTAPLGPDPAALAELAASDATARAAAELDELVGDRLLVLRSDRIDLSKNIVRGFVAYDHLLAKHPEWRERVVFVALLNRSREHLADYLAYEQEVDQAAARVNERHGTASWQPVVVDTRDDYEQTIAGFARYDVLLVNPVKDGLNLVAKEGPIVNLRDGVLVLSPEAGAYDELHDAALPIHPYDIEQGAAALHQALTMAADERGARAARLRELSLVHTPQTWLEELLAHTL
jgi:trehalose 6-phosphate synthase